MSIDFNRFIFFLGLGWEVWERVWGASRLAGWGAAKVGCFATCRESGRTCRTRTTCRTIVSRNLQCAKHFAISSANFHARSTLPPPSQYQARSTQHYAKFKQKSPTRPTRPARPTGYLSARSTHPISIPFFPKKNQRHLAYEMALFELCGNPVRMFSEARERRADMPKHPPSSIHPQLSFRDGRTPPTLRSTDNS